MVPLGDPAQARIRVPRASARLIHGLVCGEKALVRAWAFTCREAGRQGDGERGWGQEEVGHGTPVPASLIAETQLPGRAAGQLLGAELNSWVVGTLGKEVCI